MDLHDHQLHIALPDGRRLTVAELLADHRATFGDAVMTTPTGPPAPPPAPGQEPASPPPGSAPASPPAPAAAPERPEGVSEEEWAALGDPSRRAIERERRNAREADRARQRAEQERDEARRSQQAPPSNPAPTSPQTPDAPPPGSTTPAADMAALVQQAVQAALAPVLERQAATAAERIRDRAQNLAASVLHNPTDATVHLDLARMVNATGDPDDQAIRDGLAALVEQRPYLARPVDGRRAAEGSGQGAGSSGGQTLQQRVQAQLDLMKG